MKKLIAILTAVASLALAAAETPREVLDKAQFANKIWEAIPLLTEERKADEPDIGLDETPGEDMVSPEDAKAAYDWSKPPKGEWGQCASIGDRTLKPVSRTSKNVVRYPPVGDFRKKCSRSTWYRNEMAIPADWQGRQIRIYAWLWGMDALVFVNAERNFADAPSDAVPTDAVALVEVE